MSLDSCTKLNQKNHISCNLLNTFKVPKALPPDFSSALTC
jgi:hypothetical protein